MERAPHEVKQITQGFEQIIELIQRPHSACYDGPLAASVAVPFRAS
jgi:hypothetical protein